MSSIGSFKTRIVNELCENAVKYKEYYVEKEYLLFSPELKNRKYYIISCKKDNFMHLTGLKYHSPSEFYNKCIDFSLKDSDIPDLSREEKGNIRRKIQSLPKMNGLFNFGVIIQEDFVKNDVCCSIASTNLDITLGFCAPNDKNIVKPKTLLKGFKNIKDDAPLSTLILERNVGEELFGKILYGDKEQIYLYSLEEIVTDELKEKVFSR